MQSLPQFMPAGDEVTVPDPVPALATVKVGAGVPVLNVAVTERAAVMATTQAPVPVHAPDQPAKLAPLAATAVRVTEVPDAKFALQLNPQLIPVGDDVTVPLAVPFLETLNVKFVGETLNVAVTDLAAVIETMQLPEPVQAPDQPANTDPAFGVAVNVTLVPAPYVSVQSAPQLMPVGDEVTVPVPVPARLTLRSKPAAPPTTTLNMPRPCVAAASVVASSQNSWSTETLAGPSLVVAHVAPPFSLAKIPTSVPT